MIEWLKEFLKTYGVSGALALVVLLLVGMSVQIVPILVSGWERPTHADKSGASQAATADALDRHVEQSKEVASELKAIKTELLQARFSKAIADRLICIRLSKTDSQRDECARIQ